MTSHKREPQPVFILKLRAMPGTDDIRGLRSLLKILLRRYGFRCVDVSEEKTLPIKEEIP